MEKGEIGKIQQKNPIDMMIKILIKLKDKNQESTISYLLLEQKLIYSLIIENRKTIDSFPLFSISKLIPEFVQKINKISMQNFQGSFSQQTKLFQKLLGKAVNILLFPKIQQFVQDLILIQRLQILTFNNVCCIYKRHKRFSTALRCINFAVDIQQSLIKAQDGHQKYDIVTTYLNKAAIFSEMKRHQEAINIINQAKIHVQRIQSQTTINLQLQQSDERIKQKRYYGLYMKMIILYNLAVEQQHLRSIPQALNLYKQCQKIAGIIENQLMSKKIKGIISHLSNNSK